MITKSEQASRLRHPAFGPTGGGHFTETARLARAGFSARFLGLGPVGHAFTPSLQDYLPAAFAWLNEPGPAANG